MEAGLSPSNNVTFKIACLCISVLFQNLHEEITTSLKFTNFSDWLKGLHMVSFVVKSSYKSGVYVRAFDTATRSYSELALRYVKISLYNVST